MRPRQTLAERCRRVFEDRDTCILMSALTAAMEEGEEEEEEEERSLIIDLKSYVAFACW